MKKIFVFIICMFLMISSFIIPVKAEVEEPENILPPIALGTNIFTGRFDSDNPGGITAYGYVMFEVTVSGLIYRNTSNNSCYGPTVTFRITNGEEPYFTINTSLTSKSFTFVNGVFKITYKIKTNVFDPTGSTYQTFTFTKNLALFDEI